MKEVTIHEWFDLLEIGGDENVIQMFYRNLDNYKNPPTLEDQIQFVNFMAALRLHQLKHTDRPARPKPR